MKTSLITGALCGLIAIGQADAATVSNTDPVPNVTSPERDGGVGYRWTVNLGGKDRADLEGVVGAWSWDEDGFPATAKGWTHTSNWVALKLHRTSVVTIRLYRKENVPNPAGGVGGNVLFPAFTLYRGWDGDGADSHTYNNQGNVEWAEDLTYLTHAANDGAATRVEITLELPAGLYSLALGGNSPSTLREPVQGYGFTLISQPVAAPSFEISEGTRLKTTQPSQRLSGKVTHVDKAKCLRIVRDGRTSTVKFTRDAWSYTADDLAPGRNVVWLHLEDAGGKIVERKRVVIHRHVRVIPASPRGGGN